MLFNKCLDLNYCGTHKPCLNHGTCHHLGGEKFSCTCPEGISGTRCEIVEHPCAPMPCKNNGTCNVKETFGKNLTAIKKEYQPRQHRGMSSMGAPVSKRPVESFELTTLKPEPDFFCTCQPGFSGSSCEIDIDECESAPCKNGATCGDMINGYQCICPPGFSGANCEMNIDECANTPCQNGGECFDGINSFYCICPENFTGTLCETYINNGDCLTNDCKEDAGDLCASGPCHNNATCESGDGWFRCICSVGFDGPDCRININECSSQPCTAGATCIDGIGSYTCVCPPFKRGKKCEICKL